MPSSIEGNLTIDSEPSSPPDSNPYLEGVLLALHYLVALVIIVGVLVSRVHRRRRRTEEDWGSGDDTYDEDNYDASPPSSSGVPPHRFKSDVAGNQAWFTI